MPFLQVLAFEKRLEQISGFGVGIEQLLAGGVIDDEGRVQACFYPIER